MSVDILPEGWKVESVDAIAASDKYSCVGGPFGSSLTRKDYVEYEGVPVSRGNNLKIGSRVFVDEDFVYVSEEKAKKLEKNSAGRGDIILTQRGTIGQVAIIPENSRYERYILSQNQMKITINQSKVNPKYFLYYFLSKQVQDRIQRIAIGGVIPGFNLTQFREFEVVIPPLIVQDGIVAMLDSLDAKIELNRQTNETLENIAQAIFKSWFVDFDPTRAKIEANEKGQDPELAAMAAIAGKSIDELDTLSDEQINKLKITAALFPDKLVDSELGEIPEGWEEKPVSEWGNVVCGKTPPKKDANNYGGGFPFIKIPDMHGKVFATETSDSLTVKGAATQKKKQIPKGSVCVSCIATVGQVVVASEDSHTNQQINSIVPWKESYTPFLYFSMLEQNKLLHDLASGGSATLNLNTGNFSKIHLTSPGDELLAEYSDLVQPQFDGVLEQYKQSKALSKIRDSLLPKLLSGEIDLQMDL